MIHAQNLNGAVLESVRNDIGRSWNDQFAGTRDSAGAPYLRVVRQQGSDALENATCGFS